MCSTQLHFLHSGAYCPDCAPTSSERDLSVMHHHGVCCIHTLGGGETICVYCCAFWCNIKHTIRCTVQELNLIITFWLMPGVFSVQLIKQNLVFFQNEKGLLLELLTGETGKKRGSQKALFLLSVIHWDMREDIPELFTHYWVWRYIGEPPLEERIQK